MEADKLNLNGEFSDGGTPVGKNQESFIVVYKGDDYSNASNDSNAKIIYTIGLTQKGIELLGEKIGNVFTVNLTTNLEGAGTVSFTGEHNGTSVELKKETNLTFTATANTGFQFLGWYVGDTLISEDMEYTEGYTVNSDKIIVAKYEVYLEPGLYDADGNLVVSWDELVNTYGMDAASNYSTSYNTTAPYRVLTNNASLSNGTKLIIGDIAKIGNYAFYRCTNLTSIEIPNSVTSIGNSAFYNCTSLTNVTIPESITSIGNSAFYNCDGFTNVTIPDSVTSIGEGAFRACTYLTSVTIRG